jgi:hypothetical protein
MVRLISTSLLQSTMLASSFRLSSAHLIQRDATSLQKYMLTVVDIETPPAEQLPESAKEEEPDAQEIAKEARCPHLRANIKAERRSAREEGLNHPSYRDLSYFRKHSTRRGEIPEGKCDDNMQLEYK